MRRRSRDVTPEADDGYSYGFGGERLAARGGASRQDAPLERLGSGSG